ncbi:hypothetical protein LTR08_005194 [Meristemomyces frigidus]|nr:hypothetical protein LTR08_005194 [Meristemomyces frigidus]
MAHVDTVTYVFTTLVTVPSAGEPEEFDTGPYGSKELTLVGAAEEIEALLATEAELEVSDKLDSEV